MLLELVKLVDSFGFLFYYSIWTFLLGAIAFFGFYGRLEGRLPAKHRLGLEAIFSWALGLMFFSGFTANFAIFAAVIVRILLETGYRLFLSISMQKPKFVNIYSILSVGVLILLASSLWNPPISMKLLDVDNITLLGPESLGSERNLQNIRFSDLTDIRIVSQEYAAQLPKTELVETGYDIAGTYASVDVFPEKGELTWISVYEPTVFLKLGKPSPYYVSINAFNPADRQKVNASIKYSERNWLLSFIASSGEVLNTHLRLRLFHPGYMYGDGYFVPELNSWIYPYGVIDYNILPFAVVYKQVGISVLDENGTVSLYELGSVPEEYIGYLTMETNYAIQRSLTWAKYHKWTDPINYYLAHPEIFEPAEDLFYQYETDTKRFYALMQFEPRGAERKSIVAWAEIEGNGVDVGKITMYDARDLGLIGPVKAKSIIESEVSQYSKPGFEWTAFQPQFKYISNRYTYIAPIYAGRGVSRTIKAVGLVDAKTEQVKIFFWKDVLTEDDRIEEVKELPKDCELIYTTEERDFYACKKTV